MLIRRSIALIATLATPLAAQGTYSYCYQGPGTAFGVEGYQCANCGFKTQSGAANTYTFYAEPVVTQAAAGAQVAAGDVIIAVDGNPITTQAGADRFTYPGAGTHTLTVRRGRQRQDLPFELRGSTCSARGASVSGGVGTSVGTGVGGAVTARGGGGSGFGGSVTSAVGSGGGGSAVSGSVSGGFGSSVATTMSECEGTLVRLGGNGVAQGSRGDPIIIVDGVVQPNARTREQGGRFGFAVDTQPVCRSESIGDGRVRYRLVYENYPSIYAVRAESLAEKAGLRVGDVIVKVEGKSVLDNPMLLIAADARNELHMTVRRDGKDINVVMLTTP